MEPIIRPHILPGEPVKWYYKLLATVALVAFLAASVDYFWPDNGTINITRDDYNAALQKWRSRGIEEYEMVVRFSTKGCGLDPLVCGICKLDISGDDIRILEYSWVDGPRAPLAGPSDLEFLTVDSLFREVDETLAHGPFNHDGFPLDYTIKFDPTLGYPTEIERQGRQGRNRGISSEAWHLGIYKEVQSLEVIRSK